MVFVALLLYVPILTLIYTQAINLESFSIEYIAKSIALIEQGLSDMWHYVRALPFIFCYFSPSNQGLYFSMSAYHICSYSIGNHCVYGQRTPWCNIMYWWHHHYDSLQRHVYILLLHDSIADIVRVVYDTTLCTQDHMGKVNHVDLPDDT